MWNDQVRGAHDAIVEEHDVQIESSRRPSGPSDRGPHRPRSLQPREQGGGFERRFDGEHLIRDRRGCVRPPSGAVSSTCGRSDHATLRNGGDGVSRARQIRVTIAQVRSERDVRDLAHGAERRKRRRAVSIHPDASSRGSVRRMRRDARDSARKIAQGRRDLAELVRSAFELAERSRLIGRRSRDVLRPFTIAARDLRDARDALAETPDLRLLHARRVRDALAPRQTARAVASTISSSAVRADSESDSTSLIIVWPRPTCDATCRI